MDVITYTYKQLLVREKADLEMAKRSESYENTNNDSTKKNEDVKSNLKTSLISIS